MPSLNEVRLMGHVGKDPELRHTRQSQVFKFSLATSERWTDKRSGEKKESTQWHRCEIWGERAEKLAQYIEKGDPLYVAGMVTYQSYEDKEGNKRTSTVIKVMNVQFLKSRRGDGERQEPREEHRPTRADDDDIPF